MPDFKTFLILINRKTLVVATLAVVATALCRRFGITADFPLTLIAIAIVFPIVFSIGGAYKRREAALEDYGSLKAHGRAIYFAARDWLEDTDPDTLSEGRELLGDLMASCRTLFINPTGKMEENEEAVYRSFSNLSLFIKHLRNRGLATGEVSRCNQYLSKMMVAFESVKHIYQYRTPVSLRAYSDFFIVLLPVAYGPYFAGLATNEIPLLNYVMPVLFTLILVSLDNIQAHLENPFDQIGVDDVSINAEKFVARLDELAAQPGSRLGELSVEPTEDLAGDLAEELAGLDVDPEPEIELELDEEFEPESESEPESEPEPKPTDIQS